MLKGEDLPGSGALVGLRNKITTIMVVIILLFGLGMIFFTQTKFSRILTEKHQERGIIVSKEIGWRGVDFLLKGDLSGLQKLVEEKKNYLEQAIYVFVVDNQGWVLAHTFKDEFPEGLLEANKILPDQTSKVQLIETGGRRVYDVAVPISTEEGVKAGTIRLGFSEEYIRRDVAKVVGMVMGVTAAAMLLGGLVAFGLANFITQPLSELAAAARAVGHGDLEQRVHIRTNDEMGGLGKVFNQMTADLRKSETQLEEYSQTLEQRVGERTRELKQTQAQLVQSGKLAAIGELGAGVAHELNNPVTGILGYAQYLLGQIRKPDFKSEDFKACEKRLGYIKKEAERCKTIVENLLNFSRRSPEKFEPVNINQVLEDTLALTGHQLMMKKIGLKQELTSDLKSVEGNANQLQQVFTNIILNAQQAMSEGGELNIITKEKDDHVEVQLSDTGCGIPAESLKRIFDPFFTTKMDWKGTGLGLSVSYEIIQNHKGEIEVESEVDKGTTFTISLPVYVTRDEGRGGEEDKQEERFRRLPNSRLKNKENKPSNLEP